MQLTVLKCLTEQSMCRCAHYQAKSESDMFSSER